MRSMSLLLAVFILLGNRVRAAEWQNGRATNYGPTDQFKTEWSTGTCKCWGADSYREKVPCFDEISNPSHIAAVDTGGMRYTGTCGTCLLITCVDGPTRGLPYSTFPYGGCRPGAPAVMVQVTDSCPCEQNESNDRWCCQDTKRGVRHIDMATPAFASIAQEEVGVIDILFQQVPCPPSGSGPGVVWDSWQQEFDTTIESWSQSQSLDTLATVESACAGAESAGYDSILEEDRAAAAENRTVSDLVITPWFAQPGVSFDEVYNSTIL